MVTARRQRKVDGANALHVGSGKCDVQNAAVKDTWSWLQGPEPFWRKARSQTIDALEPILSADKALGQETHTNLSQFNTAAKILCWIYMGTNTTNIVLSILLYQAVIKESILKCICYLVITPFLIISGVGGFLFHLLVLGPSPYYYAIAMYPAYYLYKLYALWIIYKFLGEIRSSPSTRKRTQNQYSRIGSDTSNYSDLYRSTYGSSGYVEETELQLNLPKKFEISEDKLILDHQTCLGHEEHYAVIRGILQTKSDITEVGAKTLKVTTPTIPYGYRLLQEAQLLAHLGNNDHVLKFFGICTKSSPKEKLYLLTEYYPKGDLDTFLKDCADSYQQKNFTNLLSPDGRIDINSQKKIYENLPNTWMEFDTADMLNWAWQIASGMEHLHVKRVIHGCLQTRSIILMNIKTVKISCFSFAATIRNSPNPKCVLREDLPSRFPWRWTSIECLTAEDSIKFSTRTDVWSYGVTLWEIFTLGEVPYGAWDSDIVRNLLNGMRLDKPKYSPPQIYEIMNACWRNNPLDRPNFSLLKLFFQQLLASLKTDF